MTSLPTGTVTFLFTDLESSTRRWEEHPEAMTDALARHDEILRHAVETHGGVVFSTMGDGIAAAFGSAPDAVAAVIDLQRNLGAESWSEDTGALRARAALHTDEGWMRAPDQYMNQPLNRCARLMAAAYGGQVLISETTATLVRANLPDATSVRDLGEHRLRDLAEPMHVFQVTHPDLAADFPPIRSLDALPGNLPVQRTDLVGREELLDDLQRLTRESTLLTLTGVGGVGKTRLAMQLAADLLSEFRDGAWLIQLAPVLEADALPDALASPFMLQPRSGQTLVDTVIDFLRAKQALLVLDNCEHLLDAVAPVVDRIRDECAHVAIVATSREGLAVRGERIVAVPSLPVEAATEVFVARGLEVRADFVLTPDNEPAIRQLCERLDGIPLAIELAAARLRSMSTQEVLERIDRRFRLLTGGTRTALERHRTLQATVDWSYDLLSETERCVLDRLAVFSGGFTLDAAEAVVAGGAVDALDVFDLLAQLVDKSLVVAEERHGATRYRMLETIRQYAQERLEESVDAEDARRRHAAYFVDLVEDVSPHLYGPDQLVWFDRLWEELDNLRGAMAWLLLTADADRALRLAVATNVNGSRLSYTALGWAEAAVEIPGAPDHACFPVAASWAAWAAVFRAETERGVEFVARRDAAYAASGVEPAASSYQGPGTVALFQADFDAALALGRAWERAAVREANDYELSQALTFQSAPRFWDHPTGAVELASEGVEIARRVGAPALLSWALLVYGGMLVEADPPRSLAVLEESQVLCRLVGNDQGAGQSLAMTAWLHRSLGDHAAAVRAARDAWEYAASVGARTTFGQSLGVAFLALADVERWEGALPLQGFADAVLHGFWGTWAEDRAAAMQRAEVAVGAARVDTLTRAGAAMDDAGALAFARAAAATMVGGDRGDDEVEEQGDG
jgi:predicted ATPase/class 3 adenylate cyclase